LDRAGSGIVQLGYGSLVWIELAQDRNSWDLEAWFGSSWLTIRTGGMWECGLDRVGSGQRQLECGSVGWIELAQDWYRWDLGLWVGSSWIRIGTGGVHL
jgi:hypothetical protein